MLFDRNAWCFFAMQFINLGVLAGPAGARRRRIKASGLNQGCAKTALDHVGSGSGRGQQGSSCPETAEQACGVKMGSVGSISFAMIS